MRKEIEKILLDIIQHELGLPDNYGYTSRGDVVPTLLIGAQNIKLFNTNKLQVTIQTVSTHDYANNVTYEDDPDNESALIEVQTLNQSRLMQIDIYSRNNEARERHPEIAMALKSIYAQQQQDLYNFKIGMITSSCNNSGLDGGSDINRFTTTFNVLVHYTKSKAVDYYNKFETTFDLERGQIPDINIPNT